MPGDLCSGTTSGCSPFVPACDWFLCTGAGSRPRRPGSPRPSISCCSPSVGIPARRARPSGRSPATWPCATHSAVELIDRAIALVLVARQADGEDARTVRIGPHRQRPRAPGEAGRVPSRGAGSADQSDAHPLVRSWTPAKPTKSCTGNFLLNAILLPCAKERRRHGSQERRGAGARPAGAARVAAPRRRHLEDLPVRRLRLGDAVRRPGGRRHRRGPAISPTSPSEAAGSPWSSPHGPARR